MLFLIFGGNGWIGKQVVNELVKQNHKYVLAVSRADDKESVEKEIQSIKPTHILCLIGRTHGEGFATIDYLEQSGKIYENVRDNLFSPLVLALLAVKYNIHLTYLGTGCIFAFDDTHPFEFGGENGFSEESRPNFFGSAYSVVKGFTDELMHMLESNVLNLRIRMPISSDNSPRNFIHKITHYDKICSIPNSMTVLDDMIPVMIDMAINKRTGTINLTNPGLITHNEILEMYREIVDSSFTWKNFTLEEQAKILKAGRSNNYLDTTKLETMYPTNIKNIKDSVRDVLKKY